MFGYRMLCSNCAERLASSVTMFHLSSHMTGFMLPMVSIGSMVKVWFKPYIRCYASNGKHRFYGEGLIQHHTSSYIVPGVVNSWISMEDTSSTVAYIILNHSIFMCIGWFCRLSCKLQVVINSRSTSRYSFYLETPLSPGLAFWLSRRHLHRRK